MEWHERLRCLSTPLKRSSASPGWLTSMLGSLRKRRDQTHLPELLALAIEKPGLRIIAVVNVRGGSMLRNLPRFFSWRSVPITIIVISYVRAEIGPVMPVAALMPVMPFTTLMAEMALMFSWVGRFAKVGFRVAVTAETGTTSFRTMSPDHGNEPRNKQETGQYD